MPDNFIWTKHVEERSTQRGVGANEVWSTLRHPDTQEKTTDNKYKFSKLIGGKQVVLIASPQGSKWVILTTWIKNREESAAYWRTKKNSGDYSQSAVQKAVLKGVVGSVRLLGRLFWGRRKY